MTFAALRYRDFRILWLVFFLRSGAFWVEQVGRPVMMLELTGSPLLLGATFAAWVGASLLVAPLAGAVLDRFQRRLVVFASLLANFAGALLVLVPLMLGQLEVWQIILSAAVSGLSMEFVEIGRRAMLPAVLPEPALRSGTALLQTARTTTQIGSALLAGLVLALADFTLMYALVAALLLFACVGVLLIRAPDPPRAGSPGRTPGSVVSELTGGVRWAFEARWPIVVLALLALTFLLLNPYQGVFLPLMVIDELQMPSAWVGYLVALRGLGATLGSIGLAALTSIRSPGAMLVGLLVIGGIALLVMAGAPHVAILALATFAAAIVSTNILSVSNLAIIVHAPDEMRGRALSLASMATGAGLLGALAAGGLADILGVRLALAALAGSVIAVAVSAWLAHRVRWWLWRRRAFDDAMAEAWSRGQTDLG